MKKRVLGVVSLTTALLVLALSSQSAFATCTSTGFIRDSINMTAAQINPIGTVSGDVVATGCNIGIYYDRGDGSINKANIHGANYFGVVVNGDINEVTVNITASYVHDIGETPFNGTQHGVAIYYRAFAPDGISPSNTGSASGKISGNVVTQYQKGGITVNGGSNANVMNNTVTGLGRVDFIAQNGIQLGFGGGAQVKNNTVTGNAYTGLNCASSGGVLVVGGALFGGALTTGSSITGNTLVNNDVGVFLFDADAGGDAPASPTNIKVINNTITNDALTNLGGCSFPGYQAGVSDFGNNDKSINNTISGVGYTAPGTAATFAIPIDTLGTNFPKVHANK